MVVCKEKIASLKVGTGKIAGIRCSAIEINEHPDIEAALKTLEDELVVFEPEPGMGVTVVGSDPMLVSYAVVKLIDRRLPFVAVSNDEGSALVAHSRTRRIEAGKSFKFQII